MPDSVSLNLRVLVFFIGSLSLSGILSLETADSFYDSSDGLGTKANFL